MRITLIVSLLALIQCDQSSALKQATSDGLEKGLSRNLQKGYENGEHKGFDVRGFKKASKGKGNDDVPIYIEPGHEYDEDYGYGKGKGKGSKRGSKSGGRSKQSKKGKSQKKSHKKLKMPGHEDDDYYDDYYYYTEFPTTPAPTPVPSVPAIDDPTIVPGMITTRSANFGAFVPDNSLRTKNGPGRDFPDLDEGIPFEFPLIERTLFPGPIKLKAHSSVDLSQKEDEIFEILQFVLTPYFRDTIGSILRRYNLEVVYSSGPDTSHLGVIVTNIDLTCTLLIESSSREDLVNISHETARGWVRDFFDGPALFNLLGDLRQNGIDVNEIVFLEDEFQSGLFTGNAIASVTTTGSQKASSNNAEPDSKNRVALFASLCVSALIVGAILSVHFKGRTPREILGSFKESLDSVRDSLSSSEDSDTQIFIQDEKKDVVQNRQRSWSGSFRRHPPGGIKPAAIQKKPAFSSSFMKGENGDGLRNAQNTLMFDEQSFSVAGGDYNIPDEYDFKTSPVRSTQSPMRNSYKNQDEEFSMPEDYNTVNEDFSLYSARGSRSNARRPRPSPGANPFDYGSPAPRRSSRGGGHHSVSTFGSPAGSSRPSPFGLQSMRSPISGHYLDEWSVDSYSTTSPSARQEGVPYRDWHDAPSPNRRSQLDMPPLGL